MQRAGTHVDSTGLSGPVVTFVGLMLLASAPLIRGGNRHVAILMLEWLALLLLPVLAWRLTSASAGSDRRSMWMAVLAMAPLWIGLIQLTPLPPPLWDLLPGRATYSRALEVMQMNNSVQWRPVSLMPDATWLSLLAGLPVAAALLLGWVVTDAQLRLLARGVVWFAFFQSVVGLLQVGLLRELYFGALAYDRAIGTFANPNHFASYLAMAVPLAIYFLRATMVGTTQSRRAAEYSHRQHGRHGSGAGRQVAMGVWSAVLFFLLAGLLASLSRGGITSGLVAGTATIMLLPFKEESRRNRAWRVLAIAAIGAAVAAVVGLDGLMQRMTGSGHGSDGLTRWQLFQATWQGVVTFWPIGSGLGSYAGVFPRFQPVGLTGFAEYAHSDYIQLLMEGGLPVVLLGALAAWLIVAQLNALRRHLGRHPADSFSWLQACCGFGVLAVFLHSWFDFNLRIPANAILAAFLLGGFLRPVRRRATGEAALASAQ
ncbi:MAG: O-antigen ligase family protein [Burkholderiaceae bacterium]|nr:O-antigen ligase family protein [Burkholderiaceae bacterium]